MPQFFQGFCFEAVARSIVKITANNDEQKFLVSGVIVSHHLEAQSSEVYSGPYQTSTM